MRAINHALTGSFIGLVVGEPLVAAPLALASHFVCDVIPHHAAKHPNSPEWLSSKRFRNILIADALLCIGLVALLFFKHPLHWQLAAVCAFLAAMPDMFSVKRFLAAHTKRPIKLDWTVKIQWFQRPIGALVEVAWFVAALVILAPIIGG